MACRAMSNAACAISTASSSLPSQVVNGEQDALAEQVGFRAPAHLSFDHLDAVDVAFDGTGAVEEVSPKINLPLEGLHVIALSWGAENGRLPGRGGRGQYRQTTRLPVRRPVIWDFGVGMEEARRASARLVTSTARPAATPPATPVLGASPSSPMPTATLATGVTAAMTGSVTMGRPAW